ncbi:WD repeat-containing protein 13 [Linum grandiflorum]
MDRSRERRPEPAYSFVGMHCIFDQSKAAGTFFPRYLLTVLKFGKRSSDLNQPPSVLKQLNGHSKDVTDFDFSSNNQYIASSSMDKTVRVWELSKGTCIRVIYGVTPQLCIRFHPVIGNVNREISVFNFSTGRTITKSVLGNEITSMDHDHTGQLIFCGDGQVTNQSALSRSHRYRSSSKTKSPVTTVQYRSFSLLARGPVLLTCTQDGNLTLFSVALEIKGYLTIYCSLKLAPRVHSMRASFCPLLSLEKGEYIVAGSEDSNVDFYDLTKPKNPCVNKLQGHQFPVIGVTWNYGENLLASSDEHGVVIVWKRAKTS